MAIEVRKLGEPLLAEVVGLDVTKLADPEVWAEVDQAFLDNNVLVFRGQMMTAAEMVQFAGQFGPLEPHITKKYNHPDFDELIVMSNVDTEGKIDALGA